MEAVLGLMVILLGLSHGVETYCDGRQDGAQCYGALGGTVDIQLMDSTSEIPRYELFKNYLRIVYVRDNWILFNIIENRSVFFPSNGTFRINNLSRTDSGNYTLQTFDSDGRTLSVRSLQLFIQVPLAQMCQTNIIILKHQISGHLVCSVRNNVSNISEEQKTCNFINCTSINGTQILGWVHADSNSLCIEPTTEPTAVTPNAVGSSWFIFGLKAAVVILSLSGIWIWFTWKKKTILEGSAVPQRMESSDNSVFMIEMSPYSNT